MKTSKELISEKYTGYEAFCYNCQEQFLAQTPVNCPKCGNDEMKGHEWKSGVMVGYAKQDEETTL
jgi:hypothetical protein